MYLTCVRCESPFEHPTIRAYCDDCVAEWREQAWKTHKSQNPSPALHLTIKIAGQTLPLSIEDPVSGKRVCGLCGSDQLDLGYGFAGGCGLGSYRFCMECEAFLDFHEDTGE